MPIGELANGMHVVWHDAPGEHPLSGAVEMQESVLHQGGDFGPLQPASAQSGIELFIDLRDGIMS